MSGGGFTKCLNPGCDRASVTRGFCHRDYLRWWRATPKSERSLPSYQRTKTLVDRFWEKVAKGPGCWEWTGARRPSGHGMFATIPGSHVPAHRFSLELALGHGPSAGQITCHRCDNPPCVNPSHLYFGTHQDNANDAWTRGRMPVGSERAPAIMNEEDVICLRHRYAAGGNAKVLAEEYGIAVSTLRLTVLGLKWKHVGGPITSRRRIAAEKAA